MEALKSESVQNHRPSPYLQTLPEWQRVVDFVENDANQVLEFNTLSLLELDEDSEQSPLLVLRTTTDVLPRGLRIPLTDAAREMLELAVGRPFPINVSCPEREKLPLIEFVTQQGSESALVAVISHAERPLGCLVGCTSRSRDFSSAEVAFFSLISSHIAMILENSRLCAATALRRSKSLSLQAVRDALVKERSLDVLFSVVIDEAIRLSSASDAQVLILEEGGDQFKVYVHTDSGIASLIDERMSYAGSLCSQVVASGKPVVSNDVMNDPQANRDWARRLNVHTLVVVPLKIQDRTIGTVSVFNREDRPFNRVEIESLCSFVDEAAIAIDNAQLYSKLLLARDEIEAKALELQNLLVETMNIREVERRRVAAEMHDQVVSRIVAALYEVEAGTGSNQESDSLDQKHDLLKQLLNEAVESTRAAIYDLWPSTLDFMGLIPALREMLRHHEERTGLSHTLDLREYAHDQDLPPTVRIAAYRIVEEALNNTYLHAAARSVIVLIQTTRRQMRIIVRDDGKGFDVGKVMRPPHNRHFGLIGMRERARSVRGHIRVDSAPGKGSRIILTIPVDEMRLEGT